jgi:lipopolysaccharide transport system ATP-binding protein
MYVRLAFSVAINVDPDILIIDEALSVGDGEFARKSFDRIMSMKNSGKTILFCSHALYQVEALCSRVIWLDKGLARDHGEVGRVINSYESFLQKKSWSPSEFSAFGSIALDENDGVVGTSRLKSMQISVNSCIQDNKIIQLNSLIEDLELMVSYDSDSSLPAPSVAIVFVDINGNNVTSVGTHVDRFVVERNSSGYGVVNVLFPKVPLLKGEYTIDVYLLCESGIHVYDYSHSVAKIVVKQKTLEQGVFSIPHKWF